MPKIKIFTDTSSDIPDNIREKYDIGILRFMSVFGETAYETGTELTNEQFYEKLAASDVIPTTSQTPFSLEFTWLLTSFPFSSKICVMPTFVPKIALFI